MEREASIEEKIKRAEQIYNRRNGIILEKGCDDVKYKEQFLNLIKIMDSDSYMRFKFWKKKPISKFQKADLIYEMYFE